MYTIIENLLISKKVLPNYFFFLNNQLYLHFLYWFDLNYRLANDAKGKGGERQFNGLIDVYAKTLKTDGIQVKFIFSKKGHKN